MPTEEEIFMQMLEQPKRNQVEPSAHLDWQYTDWQYTDFQPFSETYKPLQYQKADFKPLSFDMPRYEPMGDILFGKPTEYNVQDKLYEGTLPTFRPTGMMDVLFGKKESEKELVGVATPVSQPVSQPVVQPVSQPITQPISYPKPMIIPEYTARPQEERVYPIQPSIQEKRPVGRPRIYPKVEKPKRPVGRPRKYTSPEMIESEVD